MKTFLALWLGSTLFFGALIVVAQASPLAALFLLITLTSIVLAERFDR